MCECAPFHLHHLDSYEKHPSLSVIIICRFLLDLRERHVKRDNVTTHRNQITLETFSAAVIDEFGDPQLEVTESIEAS